MKNEIRRGRMPVIDHTDTVANIKEAEDGGSEEEKEEAQAERRLNKDEDKNGDNDEDDDEEEDEEDDVFKRLLSNDRLVKRIMRLL
jgi:hypothetical protein